MLITKGMGKRDEEEEEGREMQRRRMREGGRGCTLT